jgi:FKBP-type peptidyl-prolyl cis-trans isomerase FklB
MVEGYWFIEKEFVPLVSSTSPQGATITRKGVSMKPFCAVVLVVGLVGCQTTGEKEVKLETQQDKVSYSIGISVGNNLKKDSVAIAPEAFLRGVLDATADSAHRLMTNKQIDETMTTFREELQRKKMENIKAAGMKNKTEGDAFLAENAKKPGVVVLPSGLQYRIITEGKGKRPTASSVVTTQYKGSLLDGTEFDSSYKRGQPATFPVSGVIKGWTEALQLMTEGSKWELFIPASLAYGENGAGGVIPPNATLIFEVELVSIK